MKTLGMWLALAYMHAMMCGLLTLTLAIPTGWDVAVIGGPMSYLMLLNAARFERELRSIEEPSDAPSSQGERVLSTADVAREPADKGSEGL